MTAISHSARNATAKQKKPIMTMSSFGLEGWRLERGKAVESIKFEQLKWRELNNGSWQFLHPGLSVHGDIWKDKDGLFVWSARVMISCRVGGFDPIRGKAPTFEGARRIVEVLIKETYTHNFGRPEDCTE
jgi:hypothetical protein